MQDNFCNFVRSFLSCLCSLFFVLYSKKMNRIFLLGYMGCGKTTLGKRLAAETGFAFVDLDGFIEQKYHKTVADIFAEMGQDKFREIEKNALIEVAAFENVVIATGGGAPCFFNNMEIMNSAGLTVYIKMSPAQLAERLENSRAGKRPLIAGKTGEELRSFIENGLMQREQFYLQAKLFVAGSDDEIITKIRKTL
jgi:shikimate kinase